MSTAYTANGFIYPNGDDPIRNGDNVARKLAEQLPPRLVRQANSSAGENVSISSNGLARITFPTSFSAHPLVNVWCTSNALYLPLFGSAGGTNGVDSASFVIAPVRATDGSAVTSQTIAIRWVAIGVVTPAP